ncbi:MAG: putative hydrolase of the superfamily [Actinomycetota bacterium]|nr:putative hydrolase of the superfamily [Actinomycetota bacterium]
MSRYEALVVDFGGVLTTPLQDSFVLFAEALGIELQDLVRVALRAYTGDTDPLVVAFETGALSDEEFSRQFAQRLSEETGVKVDAERLVERMFGGMRLEEGMLDAVAAAKRNGFKTALLSNSWGLSGYPRERLGELMDVIVISGEVGMRKPDPAIFELTTSKLGLPPEACVFVDDHPGHLKAAQEAGMETVLHRTPAQTIPELETLLGVALT